MAMLWPIPSDQTLAEMIAGNAMLMKQEGADVDGLTKKVSWTLVAVEMWRKLVNKMGAPDDPRHWGISVEDGEVTVAYRPGDQDVVVLKEHSSVFPSDTLVTQLRMIL